MADAIRVESHGDVRSDRESRSTGRDAGGVSVDDGDRERVQTSIALITRARLDWAVESNRKSLNRRDLDGLDAQR